jgi:hypothetical protein
VRRRTAIVLIALGVALAACAPAAPTLPPVSPSPAPTARLASEAPTAAPAVTPQPLPAEIIGKWQSELSTEELPIDLEIKQGSYSLFHLSMARGRLEVDGDGLAFSHSTQCAGEGRYRWLVEGNELTFQSIEPDECPGRAAGLDGITYTRLD